MTKQLRQLTPRETFLIGGETARVYQHTGGLILLDASDRPDFGFQAFRRSGVQAFRRSGNEWWSAWRRFPSSDESCTIDGESACAITSETGETCPMNPCAHQLQYPFAPTPTPTAISATG